MRALRRDALGNGHDRAERKLTIRLTLDLHEFGRAVFREHDGFEFGGFFIGCHINSTHALATENLRHGKRSKLTHCCERTIDDHNHGSSMPSRYAA